MGFFEDNFAEGSKKAPSSYHIQWEYKTVFMCHGIVPFAGRELNSFGQEGWEMCGYDSNNNYAVFKRPKYDYDE